MFPFGVAEKFHIGAGLSPAKHSAKGDYQDVASRDLEIPRSTVAQAPGNGKTNRFPENRKAPCPVCAGSWVLPAFLVQ